MADTSDDEIKNISEQVTRRAVNPTLSSISLHGEDQGRQGGKSVPRQGFLTELKDFCLKTFLKAPQGWCEQHGYARPRASMRVRAVTPLPAARRHSPVRVGAGRGGRTGRGADVECGGFLQKCVNFYCTRLCAMICILFAVSNLASFYFSTGEAMLMMTMSFVILYHLQMVTLAHLCLAMIALFNVMLVFSMHDLDLVATSFMHVSAITILHLVH